MRDELRQTRKLLQASKMEKIALAEEAEKDCNEKVSEVFKKVIAKNTELSFVNVEFSEHRIRNANSTLKDGATLALNDVDQRRNLLRLENLNIVNSSSRQSTKREQIYHYVKQTNGLNKQRSFFEIELENLLLLDAQFYTQPRNDQLVIKNIITSVSRVLFEFWSYANSFELPKHCMLYAQSHFELQHNETISMSYSLTQPDSLYNMERGILLRRYIATLAVICQKESKIAQALLHKKHGEYLIIQLAIQAIIKISYSFEVYEHVGILKATGALLYSLLNHLKSLYDSQSGDLEEVLFDLLKQLVFTCPIPSVFYELSSCIVLCTRKAQLMAKMCINSSKDCFVSDRVRSLYRFGSKSCLIQVYSSLLELCFCSHLPVQPSQFKLILSICEHHVRFVYQCFTEIPEFILKMLPHSSFTDEEKKQSDNLITKIFGFRPDPTIVNSNIVRIDGSTLSPTTLSDCSLAPVADQLVNDGGCECYVKLCLSVVTLVFQTMYHWMLQNKKSGMFIMSHKVKNTSTINYF